MGPVRGKDAGQDKGGAAHGCSLGKQGQSSLAAGGREGRKHRKRNSQISKHQTSGSIVISLILFGKPEKAAGRLKIDAWSCLTVSGKEQCE